MSGFWGTRDEDGETLMNGELEIVGAGKSDIPPPPITYTKVNYIQPHPERKQKILKEHPEIESLYGYEWKTKWLTLALVVSQCFLAASFGLAFAGKGYGGAIEDYGHGHPWIGTYVAFVQDNAFFTSKIAFLAVVYIVGTTMNHACAMIIHDLAHDLGAATTLQNRFLALFANLPLAVPSSQSFRRYHLEHHSHQGVLGTDVDIAPFAEVIWVRNVPLRKFLWMWCFMFSYGLRPAAWSRQKLLSKWELGNIALQIAFDAAVVHFAGWFSLLYLFMCTLFTFGVHPVAAHFIQEHYIFKEGTKDEAAPQETYSYYGWLNRFILNVGFHNEHHDFTKIPWTRLPEVRSMAPEFYNNLYYHTSISNILFSFFVDADKGPHSRVVRDQKTHRDGVRELMKRRAAAKMSKTE